MKKIHWNSAVRKELLLKKHRDINRKRLLHSTLAENPMITRKEQQRHRRERDSAFLALKDIEDSLRGGRVSAWN